MPFLMGILKGGEGYLDGHLERANKRIKKHSPNNFLQHDALLDRHLDRTRCPSRYPSSPCKMPIKKGIMFRLLGKALPRHALRWVHMDVHKPFSMGEQAHQDAHQEGLLCAQSKNINAHAPLRAIQKYKPSCPDVCNPKRRNINAHATLLAIHKHN